MTIGRFIEEGGREGPKGPEKVQPDKYMMRFADGGSPVSVLCPGGGPVNICFRHQLPLRSILSFGEDEKFEVVRPSKSAKESGFPQAVYVERIKKEEYRRMKSITGRFSRKVFDSVREMPLSDETKENLKLS